MDESVVHLKGLLKAIIFCDQKVIKSRQALHAISSTSKTSVQRYLYPIFQNQCPHFLLSPLFFPKPLYSIFPQQKGESGGGLWS